MPIVTHEQGATGVPTEGCGGVLSSESSPGPGTRHLRLQKAQAQACEAQPQHTKSHILDFGRQVFVVNVASTMTSEELDILIARLRTLQQDYSRLNDERIAIEIEFGAFLDAVRLQICTLEEPEELT